MPRMVLQNAVVLFLLLLLAHSSAAHDESSANEVTYSLSDLIGGVVFISAIVGLVLACTTTWSSPSPPRHCCDRDVVKVEIVPSDMRRGKRYTKIQEVGEDDKPLHGGNDV